VRDARRHDDVDDRREANNVDSAPTPHHRRGLRPGVARGARRATTREALGARRRRDASFARARERRAVSIDARESMSMTTPKGCSRDVIDVIDATPRSTHDAHRLARARVYAHRTVDARDDDGVRGARSVDWARRLE